MNQLYTPKELAKKSGVKLDTLYHHIHRGQLKALKIDGYNCWYITRDEAHRYIERYKVGFWQSLWKKLAP